MFITQLEACDPCTSTVEASPHAPSSPAPMSFLRTMRSPMGQVTIMGVVFLLIFTAYITIQAFASQLYGDVLASNMALTLYAVFTASCFIAPAVTNVLGPRFTLFLGSLGYAALVVASLVLALSGRSGLTEGIVVFGGACCGLGAALLWTAQGRMSTTTKSQTLRGCSGDPSTAGRSLRTPCLAAVPTGLGRIE